MLVVHQRKVVATEVLLLLPLLLLLVVTALQARTDLPRPFYSIVPHDSTLHALLTSRPRGIPLLSLKTEPWPLLPCWAEV